MAYKYSLKCDVCVYFTIKIKMDGRIFIFNSDYIGEWPLTEAQLVRHLLSENLWDINREQDNYFPLSIRITPENFKALC